MQRPSRRSQRSQLSHSARSCRMESVIREYELICQLQLSTERALHDLGANRLRAAKRGLSWGSILWELILRPSINGLGACGALSRYNSETKQHREAFYKTDSVLVLFVLSFPFFSPPHPHGSLYDRFSTRRTFLEDSQWIWRPGCKLKPFC